MSTKSDDVTKTVPGLPTNRAFVVQFRRVCDGCSWRCEGRVEHLVSGQVIHFSSWPELQKFIEHTLIRIAEKPP